LLHPSRELSFVELVILMDVELAHLLALELAGGGDRTQRRASEESHFDVVHEGMDAEEPLRQFFNIRRAGAIANLNRARCILCCAVRLQVRLQISRSAMSALRVKQEKGSTQIVG
jgi:hypothetical protein